MSVRVRYAIQASVSSTFAEEKDLGNVKFEVVTDVEAKGGTWKTVVPAGSANLALATGNVATVQLLCLRVATSDPNDVLGPITLKRNSTSGEPQTITPVGDAKEAIYLTSTDGVTSLYVTNALSVDVDVWVTLVGI